MGIPWFLFMLLVFHSVAEGYDIKPGDTDLILNWTVTADSDIIDVRLQENNQIIGSDHLLLFTLTTDEGVEPNWRFPSQMFAYEINGTANKNEYEFYTTQYIDYETEVTHIYLISIILGKELAVININIINYDDESPTLSAPVCSMKENTDYGEGTTECVSTLSDPDGWLNQTTFNIINSNPNASKDLELEDKLFQFSFNRAISDTVYNATVYLTTLRQLDYETKIFYSFVVQAKDGANHTTIPNENVTCIVDVIDLNDMPPEWTDYFTTTQIQEEAPYVFNVTAVDGDRQINAPINYYLEDYDKGICTESCVSITTENGKGIITVDPIDRDAQDITTYKFQIRAMETDDPPYNVTLDITFFVDDIDDNSPLFMNITISNDTNIEFLGDEKLAEFTFYENFAGTIDGQILIQDIDTGENAQFSVELIEDESKIYDVEYTDAFLIVPTAGYRNGIFQITVRNYTYLDFENIPWQNFSFYVHSEGTKNSSMEDNLLVKIHLLDYNDELPIFANASYTTQVNETIKLGENIITVKATDRDAEDFELRHELVGADAIISLVKIDSVEGIITVGKDDAFDYDRINPVIFQVQAIDLVGHTTTVPVTVELLDVNNKAPTYTAGDVITVDENQKIGTTLNATIIASDVDTTRNLTADIDWTKSYARKNSLKLNSTDPEIQQAIQFLSLNYSKISEDSISIELSVNDNNADETAPDYETFDTLYLNLIITDLNTELPEFVEKMSIDALIVININDINDNPPIFTPDSLKKNRTIYEKSKIDTIVGTIEAVDADVGDTVTYSCSYTNETLDWLACDQNGQITAKTANIDADTDKVKTVDIDCIATDKYWITQQIFSIYILDTNNQDPYIMVNDSLNAEVVVEVYEKSDAETIVTTIGYKDADRDVPFHTVECKINNTEECFESFKIENNVIKVSKGKEDIDRDTKKAQYTCTPTCYDNPHLEQNDIQRFNTTARFVIKLLDINDHCPEMITSELDGSENLKQGDVIGYIVAEDLDEGDNAEIDMNIMTVIKLEDNEDYTNQNLFIMNKDDDTYYINATRKQWQLLAQKDLRDYYGEYIVQLYLTDLGIPPQSTEDANNTDYKEKAKLQLTINKYNYYPPVFVFPNSTKLNFSLSSEQEPGTPLVMYYNKDTFANIEITDGDEDETCIDKWEPEFDVILTNENTSLVNFFRIKQLDRCVAQLQVTDSYDKLEAIDIVSYQLRLTVQLADATASGDEASYSESIELKMNFVDINDDPVFDTSLGPWEIYFQEDDSLQSEDLPEERRAFYANVEDSDDITKYYFLQSDNRTIQGTFAIQQDTGTVALKKSLDYLEIKYYEFQIQAARNQSGVASKEASRMSTIVHVLDINNHVPQWTQESFFGALLRSTQEGSTVVTLNATDLDEIDQGKLTYSLNSTIIATGSDSLISLMYNIDQAFLLNEKTGAITLNFQVDYDMYGFFFFTVKVQDVQDEYGHGPFENITSVTIHIVADDNSVTFKFENTLEMVTRKRLEILETITANLGWNCLDQSISSYSQNGVTYDNITAANIYCVNNNTLLTADDMKNKLNNINIFQQLRQDLLEFGILLQSFNSDTTSVANLESTLKAALIGVSVGLGALCLILGITFFLKARELNRRLKKLTVQKFGSDESNLNRQGFTAPTTNIFAVEGSNPVFNNDMIQDDLNKAENSSIHSGNSDLIGIEDNPEFDDMFGEEKF